VIGDTPATLATSAKVALLTDTCAVGVVSKRRSGCLFFIAIPRLLMRVILQQA
jgi:hypothetical protein